MLIVKYILLGLVVCLTIYFTIDTIVYIVKKVKQKKQKNQESSNQDKTE